MPNPLLISVAAQHRRDVQKLTNLSTKQWHDSQRYARTLPQKEWAKFTRAAFTQTISDFAPIAAAQSAAHYDTNRQLWIAQYGIKKAKSFAADRSLVMGKQEQIIEARKQELGFHIDRAFKGEISIGQVSSPAQMLVSSGIADFDREEQKSLVQEDNLATEVQQLATSDGCEFCQYACVTGAGEFHAGCGCSAAAAFDGGDPNAYREPWMDDFQKELDEARESLLAQQEEVGYGDRYDTTRISTTTGKEKETSRLYRPPEVSITTKNLLREVRAARSGKLGDKMADRVGALKDARSELMGG
jgi:hypothetical protein